MKRGANGGLRGWGVEGTARRRHTNSSAATRFQKISGMRSVPAIHGARSALRYRLARTNQGVTYASNDVEPAKQKLSQNL